MHAAWFNDGGSAISETIVPIVVTNSTTTDPSSGNTVINVGTTLISIVDVYGRAVPGTTVIKFDINSEAAYIRPITNTSNFQTYTGPFTAVSAFPGAASYDYIYVACRAFDSVTGDSVQTEPNSFQTRIIPQPGGTP